MAGARWRAGNGCRRLLAAGAAAVALAAGAPHTLASDEATFKAAFEAALAARRAAEDVGFEWRDTKKLLRQARSLAKKGEYARAVELAHRARRQGELGVMQAKEQEAAWRAAVLK